MTLHSFQMLHSWRYLSLHIFITFLPKRKEGCSVRFSIMNMQGIQ